MENGSGIYLKSLREQVYEYLRRQMNTGELKPGEFIDIKEISNQLGISKTPLRDALLQLEVDEFVKILPRRGVMVNTLTMKDIKNYYEIIGALEGVAIISAFDRLTTQDIDRMAELNMQMKDAIDNDDFDTYYDKNLEFHNTYILLSDNERLIKTVTRLKQRLYDFPRRKGFVKEWEVASIGEHSDLIELLYAGDAKAAADFVRDVHWSFKVQERFIKRYYFAYKVVSHIEA